jgi:hypothetical protein
MGLDKINQLCKGSRAMTTQPAIIESQLHLLEQKQPWERQPGESAKWFMRFRRYLMLGPKRSVNAVFEAEQREKAVRARGKISTCWYNASRRYQWEARADAWDAEQSQQKALMLRQIAMKCSFVSRPFRIVQLNSAATTLMRELEKGQEAPVYLAMVKQLRELMHDINAEVEGWNVPIDSSCDAAAMAAFEQKIKRQEELQQEREMIEEEEIDFAIAQLERREQQMQAHREMLDEILAGQL